MYLFFSQIDPSESKAPPGWLHGEANGKKGLFPANYAERITEEEAKSSDKSQKEAVTVSPPESSSTVKSLTAALNMQFSTGGTISPAVLNQNSSVTNTNVVTEVREKEINY